MAGSSGFSISITAKDQASGTLDGLNKRLARLSAPAERFNKSLAKFGDVSGLSRVTEGVRGLGMGAADAFRSLDRMASPLASITSVASIAGMAALTRQWAQFGNQVGQTSYRLNMPVEKLGSLRGAMRLAGGSASDLDSGLRGLDEKLRGAAFGRDTGAIQMFRSLGVGFGDAEHGARSASDALGDIAESLQGKTPGAQSRILEGLGLGDSFLPLLKNGRKGLADYQKQAEQTGGVMTGQMVQDATKMNKAWQELGLTVEGVGNRLVDYASGPVTKVLEIGAKWIENNKQTADSITAIGTGILALGAIKPAAWVARMLGLGAVGEAAVLASPVLLSGDTGPNAGTAPGGAFFGNNGAFSHWWGAHAPSWLGGGSSNAPAPISVPSGPTNAASTMRHTHDFFRAKGLTEEQTAGILSNIAAESGFNANKPGDGGTSYGLFQHHAERLAAMQRWAGTSAPSEQQQLDYTWQELNTSEKGTLDRLRSVNTAGQAGLVFAGFERPADGQGEAMRRGQAAGQFMQSDNQFAQAGDRAPGYLGGHVQVDVHLKGAPAGTTAKAVASGAATTAPPRIEMPFPGY